MTGGGCGAVYPALDDASHHVQHDAEKCEAELPRTETEENGEYDPGGNNSTILGWDGPNDPQNPYNWTKTRKWLVTGAALFGTLVIPLNGTSITVAATEINKEFGISDASFPNSYWPVTSWSVGGAVFIVIGLPLMEDLGVRLGYLSFYVFFLLMIIPQAVATNFATLIVTRFFSGGCVALLANTIGSMIPDVWEGDKARSLPVSIYILVYLTGSTLAPPMFAGIMQHIGNWRWIFYVQLIIYGAFLPFFAIMIQETRGSVILRQRAKQIREKTGKQVYAPGEANGTAAMIALAKSAYRPMYLLATEPVLMASTLWSAFSFGTVFVFTQSVEQVFESLYDWPSYYTGYVQVTVVIGEILGFFVTQYGTTLYFRSARRNPESPGHPIPEARLYVSIVASFFGIAGGMFVYAWTSYPFLPWIAPAIGLTLVGIGIQVVVSAVADYIEDAYAASAYTGSAISAVAAGENIVAGFLPLAAQSMYATLGFQWASTLLGFLALLLSLAPVIFVWKGRLLRERSPFMRSEGQGLKSQGTLVQT